MNKKQSNSVLDLVRAGFVCVGLDGPPINTCESQEIFMRKDGKIIMVDISGKIYMVTPSIVKTSPPVDIYSVLEKFSIAS